MHLPFSPRPAVSPRRPRWSADNRAGIWWAGDLDQAGRLHRGGDRRHKVRKLEWLIGEARLQGATHIVTQGAVQSNHVPRRGPWAPLGMTAPRCWSTGLRPMTVTT